MHPCELAEKINDLIEGGINDSSKLCEIAPQHKLNEHDDNGNTVAHYAAQKNLHGVIKFLIIKNADITLKNNEGMNAAHIAARFGSYKTLEILSNFKVEQLAARLICILKPNYLLSPNQLNKNLDFNKFIKTKEFKNLTSEEFYKMIELQPQCLKYIVQLGHEIFFNIIEDKLDKNDYQKFCSNIVAQKFLYYDNKICKSVNLLHIAAHYNKSSIFNKLITKYKIDFTVADSSGLSPIEILFKNHQEIINKNYLEKVFIEYFGSNITNFARSLLSPNHNDETPIEFIYKSLENRDNTEINNFLKKKIIFLLVDTKVIK